MQKKELIFLITIITVVAGLSLFIPGLATYTSPQSSPPNGNTPGFLNTGHDLQEKTGPLVINVSGIAQNALIIKTGSVCVGANICQDTLNHYGLEVSGGPLKTTGGLVIQNVNSQTAENNMYKEKGSLWLRTDI